MTADIPATSLPAAPLPSKVFALRDNKIQEVGDDEVDVELISPNNFFSTHINLIPMHSAVQAPRLFYGARFYNQALPLINAEAPLVRNIDGQDKDGLTFDEKLGKIAGALSSDVDGEVAEINREGIKLKLPDGSLKNFDLYDNFPFNRKSVIGDTEIYILREEEIIRFKISEYILEEGDKTLSYNPNDHSIKSWQDVTGYIKHFCNKKLLKVTYDTGFQVTVTEDHSLLTHDDEGFITPIYPKECIVNETLSPFVSLKETDEEEVLWAKIVSIEAAEKEHFVYDLEVKGSQAFAVNGGLLVHNTAITHTPTVKLGDIIKPGQLLAKSNYTDDKGALALGMNARVGLVPFKGHSMDDAIVVSSAFAKKLTSDHSYTVDQDFDNDTKGGRNHFVSLFPTQFKKNQIRNIDEHGVVKPGTIVHPGDPLILSTRPRVFSSTTSQLGKLSKAMRQSRHDSSKIWESEVPGQVTDVAKTKTGWKVVVKSATPAQIGDKIVFRSGQKSFHADTEVLTSKRGFIKISELNKDDEVAALFEGNIAKFTKPIEASSYLFEGSLYGFYNEHASYLVTDNHRIWCKSNSGDWHFIEAKEAHNTEQTFMALSIDEVNKSTAKITNGDVKAEKESYYREEYKGPVYCLQVDGLGVILTKFRNKMMWNGNSIISSILTDEHMPRTKDGKPLEVLLNPLSVPSRVNSSLIYELLLGKVAAKKGQPIKLKSFTDKDVNWFDVVSKELKDNDIPETEEVFDPMSNKILENPITVGIGHILKLHHTSVSKKSARGQASYDANQQPLKGGSEAAQAKRLSGLEVHSLLSAGAYKTLKEGATLRGQKNDQYWRALRQGYKPQTPGAPFVWEKFLTLLTGAGLHARKINNKGKLRLGPFTDDELDKHQPIEIKSGELVDLHTLDPIPGGLFDQTLVGSNKWGKIPLPFKVPNPAFEPAIRQLLGLTEKDLRAIMAGKLELPEHLR